MSHRSRYNQLLSAVKGRCRAALPAALVTASLLGAACGTGSGSAVGVTGTWVSRAEATPVVALVSPFASPGASPVVVPESPTSGPSASPVATPATPQATPHADNRVSATLAKGIGPQGQAVDPGNSFAPSTDKIYLVFQTHGLPADTHLEAIWIADKVDAPVPANYEVTRSTVTVKGDQAGNFTLAKPNPGFPLGSYHVDLYLDGKLIDSYPFTVK